MTMAIIGYAIIIIMMYLILSNKALPAFCFAVLPVIGAFIAGFSVKEILEFINFGIGTTWKTAILFIFSVIYFGVMNDVGMFDKLVSFLVKMAGSNITLVMIATSLIAVVGHIDGATASTYLISIPVMLPLYEKLKLRKVILLANVGIATGVMNLVPWGGPTIRAATAINGDANTLWVAMIPMQIFGLIIGLVMAVYFAYIEKNRLAKEGISLKELKEDSDNLSSKEDKSLKKPKLLIFNYILTLIIIGFLIKSKIPTYMVFMFGTVIALAVNFPSLSEQNKRMMAHAPNCIGLTITLLCAGVFLGIFAKSGMIAEMAKVLINILPSALRQYLHLIVGILGAPMGMIMGPDPYYYAVMPLIIETVQPLGVTATQVAHAMLIGENVALAVSPCVATTFLAIGMAGVELKDHIKFSFKYMWLVSVIMLIFAKITGIA